MGERYTSHDNLVLLLVRSTVIFMVPNLAIIFKINNNKPLILRRTEIRVSHINLLQNDL